MTPEEQVKAFEDVINSSEKCYNCKDTGCRYCQDNPKSRFNLPVILQASLGVDKQEAYEQITYSEIVDNDKAGEVAEALTTDIITVEVKSE